MVLCKIAYPTPLCVHNGGTTLFFISLYNFSSEIAVFSYCLVFLVKFSEAINSDRKKNVTLS